MATPALAGNGLSVPTWTPAQGTQSEQRRGIGERAAPRVDSLLTVAYRTDRTPAGADSCSGKREHCRAVRRWGAKGPEGPGEGRSDKGVV